MQIMDYLCQEAVTTALKGKNKKEVIAELVRLLAKAKKISEADNVIEILLEREELGSTGIGQGVAIPHGKTKEVKDIVIAFGSSAPGLEFEALDGEPVQLVFLILAPLDSAGMHLKALAKISRLLRDKFFRQSLKDAKTPEEAIRIIKNEDSY